MGIPQLVEIVAGVSITPSSTAAPTSVALTGVDQRILAPAAAGRVGATVYNDQGAGAANLYLLLTNTGAAASASQFTVMLAPGGYFETPFGWQGEIRGFSTAASGNARVTELAA